MHRIVLTAALASLALSNPAVATVVSELENADLLVQEDELDIFEYDEDLYGRALHMIEAPDPFLPGTAEFRCERIHWLDYDPFVGFQSDDVGGVAPGPCHNRPLAIFGFT